MLLIRSLIPIHLTFAKHQQSIRKSRDRGIERRAEATNRRAHSRVSFLGVRGTGNHDDGWVKDDSCVPKTIKHRAILSTREMAKEAQKEEDEETKTEVMDEDEKDKEEKYKEAERK